MKNLITTYATIFCFLFYSNLNAVDALKNPEEIQEDALPKHTIIERSSASAPNTPLIRPTRVQRSYSESYIPFSGEFEKNPEEFSDPLTTENKNLFEVECYTLLKNFRDQVAYKIVHSKIRQHNLEDSLVNKQMPFPMDEVYDDHGEDVFDEQASINELYKIVDDLVDLQKSKFPDITKFYITWTAQDLFAKHNHQETKENGLELYLSAKQLLFMKLFIEKCRGIARERMLYHALSKGNL